MTLRAGIALLLALVLSPNARTAAWSLAAGTGVLTVLGEVLTGLAMGYIMNLLFAAAIGRAVDRGSHGLWMVNILIPRPAAMPIIGQLHRS